MKSKPKISQWKSCSTNHLYFPPPNPMILKAFAELLATKMKPTKRPAKGKKKKKNEQEEGNKRGQEKAKGKIWDCFVTFKPKSYLGILFSAYVQTSKADIWLFKARDWPEHKGIWIINSRLCQIGFRIQDWDLRIFIKYQPETLPV